MKKFIVTVVDSSDTCDGKAHVLDVCSTKDEAVSLVRNDIERWCDDRADGDYAVDFDSMSVWVSGSDDGCEWNIEEVEVPLAIDNAKVKRAMKVLEDNGIEPDETMTVLQAIGYALLDAEIIEM